MESYDYDLFVIGAGSGGVRAARMAATFGARVAVAEDRYLGGTCVNVGCVPKKLFVYASHFREDFHDAGGFGWNVTTADFDWDTLRDNKTREIERLNQVYDNLLVNSGVEIINGRGRIVDANTVSVNGSNYSAKNILIATGGWPFIPDFPGAEHVISSNEVFYLETLPKKVLVVGGGYIAVEFSSIFNGLGVETELVYRGPLFLRHFDQEVREVTAREMTKKGIKLKLSCTIEQVSKNPDGSLTATLNSGEELTADCILYATGRKPYTADLGLENVNVATREDGSIEVDDFYQTTEPSIYALGDVIGGMELTPVALAEGMALANGLFNNNRYTLDYDNIATAVFCQPPIGTVGLTEQEARERYTDIDIYSSSFRPMKHTLSGSNEKTFMKIIVNKADDRVLGVHMVGAEAGEIIQGVAIALNAGATKAVFDRTIGVHPTSAEEFVSMRSPN
jgi:glutathione reductase (NADPH)